jgi:hypothetical protein
MPRIGQVVIKAMWLYMPEVAGSDPSIGYGFLFFDSEEKVVTLHSALPDDDNAW